MKTRIALFMLVPLLTYTSCGKVKSDEIKPSATYITMSVKNSENNRAECYTRLSVKDELGNSIEIVNDEFITCNGTKMKRSTDLTGNYVFYTALVLIPTSRDFTIEYKNGSELKATGTVALPPDVQVNSPNNGFSVSPGQSFAVQWTPSLNNSVKMSIITSYTVVGSNASESRGESYWVDDSDGLAYLTAPAGLNDSTQLKLPMAFTISFSRSVRHSVVSSSEGHIDAIQNFKMIGTIK